VGIFNHTKEENEEEKEKEQIEEIEKLRKENEELINKYENLANDYAKLQASSISSLESLVSNYKKKLEASESDEGIDSDSKLLSYTERQKRIFRNKENHGFNTTNIYQEARYILEEVAELMRAIEKNDRENMKEELADIVIFAYGCAEVARLGSLDDEIFKKMEINEKREYHKSADGDFVKDTK
jgi:NTP pyrophosphatase (non-canonical NTP hydrolase)